MFSQLIPSRPTCPIIIDCMNEITQWLSSFHWPTKLLDLGTLGGKKERDVEGTIWHSHCCGLWIIILRKLAKWAHLSGVISWHLDSHWRGRWEWPCLLEFDFQISRLPKDKLMVYYNNDSCSLSLFFTWQVSSTDSWLRRDRVSLAANLSQWPIMELQ